MDGVVMDAPEVDVNGASTKMAITCWIFDRLHQSKYSAGGVLLLLHFHHDWRFAPLPVQDVQTSCAAQSLPWPPEYTSVFSSVIGCWCREQRKWSVRCQQ